MALTPATQEFNDLRSSIDSLIQSGEIKTKKDIGSFLEQQGIDFNEYMSVYSDYEKQKESGLLDLKNVESTFSPGKIAGDIAGQAGEGLINLTALGVDVVTAGQGGKKFKGLIQSAAESVDEQLQKTKFGEAVSTSLKETFDPNLNLAEQAASDLFLVGLTKKGIKKLNPFEAKTKKGKMLQEATEWTGADVLTRDTDEQYLVDVLSLVPELEEPLSALAINPDDSIMEARLKQVVDAAALTGVFGALSVPTTEILKRTAPRLLNKARAINVSGITKPVVNSSKRVASKVGSIEVAPGIFNQKATISEVVGDINTKIGRVLLSTAGMPKELAKSYIKKTRYAESIEPIIRREVKKFDGLTKKYKKELDAANIKPVDLNEILSLPRKEIERLREAGQFSNVPDELVNQILKMRIFLNAKEKKISDLLNIPKDSKLGIKFADDGSAYVTRTFEAFTDPSWSKDIAKVLKGKTLKGKEHNTEVYNIVNNARNHLRKDNPNLTDAQLNGIISDIVKRGKDGNQSGAFLEMLSDQNKFGATVKILKGRKKLDKPILDLLGEVKDPTRNFADTMRNQNRLIAEVNYLKDIKNFAEKNMGQKVDIKGIIPGVPNNVATFLRKGEVGPDVDATRSLGDLTESLGAFGGSGEALGLNKIITTDEMYNVLKKGIDTFSLDGPAGSGLARTLYTGYRKTLGYTQAAETIYDHTAHALNIYGMGQQLAMNGYLFTPSVFKTGKESAEILLNRARAKDPKSLELIKKLKQDGIIDSNLTVEAFKNNLDRFGNAASRKKGNIFVEGVRKANNITSSAYGAADDYGKLVGFLIEEQRLKKMFPNKTADEIREEASERIRNVLPSYSTAAPIVRTLGKLPFGTYALFPAEVVRTQFHIARYGLKDLIQGMKTGNMAQANNGFFRLASAGAVTTGTGLAIKENNEQNGVDSITERAINLMLPSYQRNSSKFFTDGLYLDKETGEIMTQFVDTGFLDATEYTKGPFRRILGTVLAGGDITERELNDMFGDIMSDLSGPFISEKFLTAAVLNASRGVDADGRPIEGDTFVDRLSGELLKVAIPGMAKNPYKLIQAIQSERKEGEGKGVTPSGFPNRVADQALFNATGIRNNTFNVSKSAGYSIGEDARIINELDKEFKTYMKKLPSKQYDSEDIQDIYKEYIRIQNEKLEAMARLSDKAHLFSDMEFDIKDKDGKIIGRERFGLQRVLEAASRKGIYTPSKEVMGAITDADSEEGTRGIFIPTKFGEKELYNLLEEKGIPLGVIQGIIQISNRYAGLPLRKVSE